jgi:hypothetical protein
MVRATILLDYQEGEVFAPKEPAMAKKKRSRRTDINKTQAVADYLAEHSDAMPRQIAEDLTKQHGVEFTPTGVSTTKSQLKKAGRIPGGKRRGRPKGSAAKNGRRASSSAKVDISDLVAAKKMAERLGGVAKAREVMGLLAQLE